MLFPATDVLPLGPNVKTFFFLLGSSQTSLPPVGSSGSFSLPSPIPGPGIIFHPALASLINKRLVFRAEASLGCQGGCGSLRTWELVSVQPSVPPTQSNPLLAGLPLDPDYSVPCHCSLPSPSNVCLAANEKCDKCCGLSSEKTLAYTFHWSRTPDPEILQPAQPENIETIGAWRPGRDSGPRSHGSPLLPSSDSQEHCNDQDLPKRHHSNTKKPLETSSSKARVKSTVMIPESQKLLRCELESLKCQLQAQTKAFEFLNHSVTMLEKESCLQQIKIQQLVEVLGPTSRQADKEGLKWDVEEGRQELYEALAKGLQGLQKTLRDNQEVQRARTTRCLQLLAQEIRDSKKFLWEELELVREEVTYIYQKLQAQEEEITVNLANIQKMQKTQVKCRKVLTKMKQQGYETSNCPETKELPPEGSGFWRDDLQKELGDIWSAVHVLQNSFDGLSISSGGRPRAARLRGYKGHRCLSPPVPCWDSDSNSDQDPSQPLLSKSRSFSPGLYLPLPQPTLLPLLACPGIPQYGPSQLPACASAP
ncbi:LOW QUALITY PROTEIN: coiled-coil domain-containing protein 159 [Hippopotamus amphibius kiboko]|uniref:LOW QUALITY PROTEIN: coiled-coil domain-containing protein 159 n=1 Tax=Hippopotamus amphibius kiboko TaxID=575201 RepID=UPI00259823BA|nr:LOW QUALITY PROTEIN: coiled-coil domain-containing protein 159 [Hippopotamus amphibius kiboko]